MLKLFAGMEEPSVAQALIRLFSGGRRHVKSLHSSCVCSEFTIQGAVPLGRLCCLFKCLKNIGLVAVKEH